MKVQGKRFLVTGGASLIGSHVVEALLAAGATSVRILDNLSADTAADIQHRLAERSGAELIQGDVLRTTDVLDAIAGVHGVFHGAALITKPMAEHPETGVDVNVRGTAVVLAAAAHGGVEKVVLMSSVSVYGNCAARDVAESTSFITDGLGWPSQLYGAGKLLAEGLCRAYAERYGLAWLALRAPSVYGPYQHARGLSSATLVELYRALRDEPEPLLTVDPDEAHDYLYAADVADAAVAAFNSQVSGTAVNISSGQPTTFREVVETVQQMVGQRPVRYGGPGSGVRLTASSDLSYSWAKAHELLGWQPRTSLAAGLAHLVRWLEAGTTETGGSRAPESRGSDLRK